MADVYRDRVRETSHTSGTGPIALGGAVSGFQPFSILGNGSTCRYTVQDANGVLWMAIDGTYSSGGNSLSRDTILDGSSGPGVNVSLSNGQHQVFLTPDATALIVRPETIMTGASPGNYTLLASGIVFRNAAGGEIWRIWGTDPDDTNDWNSGNLYIGCQAGNAQPTDNTSAGFTNVGIGLRALLNISTGASNVAVGPDALRSVTTGDYNLAFGQGTGALITTGNENTMFGSAGLAANIVQGSNNICIGHITSPTADMSDTIGIGKAANASAAGHSVIGGQNITDTYFGTEAAASAIHCAAGAIGNVPSDTLAFYGVSRIPQQVLATGAGHTVDDVITYLQLVGLVRQSSSPPIRITQAGDTRVDSSGNTRVTN